MEEAKMNNSELDSSYLNIDETHERTFPFSMIERIDEYLISCQYNEIDNFFKDFDELSKFINYFSGFLGYQKIKNEEKQNILINVLSYLIFKNIEILKCFVHFAVNLLVGGVRNIFISTESQQLISFRYFLNYFNEEFFDIMYSDLESLPLIVLKNLSLTNHFYLIFLKTIAKHIPKNSKYISSFIEVLFNSQICWQEQLNFVAEITRKSPESPSFYSVLFFMKNATTGSFTRASLHYLIPLIGDFYSHFEIWRLSVWHYMCRLIQFCIIVKCLKKQRKKIVNGENPNSLQLPFFKEAFEDVDTYGHRVPYIFDLIHALYDLHIPLLCRTIYMLMRCAQINYRFFKNHVFDESYIVLTTHELNQICEMKLPNDKKPAFSLWANPDSDKKQKRLFYIHNYLYDQNLLNDFDKVRPREINLQRLLEFPSYSLPLRKGITKAKISHSESKKNPKFVCSPLSVSLYGTAYLRNKALKQKSENEKQQTNTNFVIKTSPFVRIKQFRESFSASAE